MRWTPEEKAELDRIQAKYDKWQAEMAARRRCLIEGCPNRVVPGKIRCAKHGGSDRWSNKRDKRIRDANYTDPTYRRNRAQVLAREPTCHWRFPGCTIRSTTAEPSSRLARAGRTSSLTWLARARVATAGGAPVWGRRDQGQEKGEVMMTEERREQIAQAFTLALTASINVGPSEGPDAPVEELYPSRFQIEVEGDDVVIRSGEEELERMTREEYLEFLSPPSPPAS